MPVHFLPSVYGGIYVQQYMDTLLFSHHVCLIQVTTAPGFHLFPFRTEKLSPVTPMVLRNSGRVGRRRFFEKSSVTNLLRGTLFFMPAGRIPISSMQCFVTIPRSAFWLPHAVLSDVLTQCFVACSYCASLHLLKVSPCGG